MLGVRSCGGQRRRLVRTHGVTRGTRLGRSFLTGVDRRVHAPLGTVIKFSALLTSPSSASVAPRRGRRCVSAVGHGDRLLLGLVGSVLRLSHVRSKCVSFSYGSCPLSTLVESACRARGVLVPKRLRFLLRRNRGNLVMRISGGQLIRIVAGFLGGTSGFAQRNSVGLK